jgi:hypothetical protein
MRIRMIYRKKYGGDEDGTAWKVIQIGGKPQITYSTNASHDCSGQVFCSAVDSYLWGLVNIGHYNVDV